MSPKDTELKIRCSTDFVTACTEGAIRMSSELPVKISRNAFVENAVREYLRGRGWDDLAALASPE